MQWSFATVDEREALCSELKISIALSQSLKSLTYAVLDTKRQFLWLSLYATGQWSLEQQSFSVKPFDSHLKMSAFSRGMRPCSKPIEKLDREILERRTHQSKVISGIHCDYYFF